MLSMGSHWLAPREAARTACEPEARSHLERSGYRVPRQAVTACLWRDGRSYVAALNIEKCEAALWRRSSITSATQVTGPKPHRSSSGAVHARRSVGEGAAG